LLIAVAIVHPASALIARRSRSAIVSPLLARSAIIGTLLTRRPLTIEWPLLTLETALWRSLTLRAVEPTLRWPLAFRPIEAALLRS
jgi:hypothetical protein